MNRRLGRARWWLAIGALAVLPRCTCAGVCGVGSDCPAGAACVDGACIDAAPVDAPAIAIVSVDGDGIALAPTPSTPPEGVDPADLRAVAHRTQGALIVRGTGLDTVFSAVLEGAGGDTLPLQVASALGDTMTLTLPPSIGAGLFTLALIGTAGNTARAQVFLLQGEPARTSLVEPRVATPDECPTGGTRLAFGLDDDLDGALDAAEENAALERLVCNGVDGINGSNGADGADGDTLLTCNTDECSIDRDLIVRGLPVLTHIDAPLTVLVPGDAPTIAAGLELFRDVRITTQLTILLAADHLEPDTIDPDHPDGDRIRIEGSLPSSATVLQFNDRSGFTLIDGNIGTFANLTIQGNDAAGSVGLLARNSSHIRIEPGVIIGGFTIGVLVDETATVVADGAIGRANTTSFVASRGGHLRANGALSDGDETGFISTLGGTLEANGCRVESSTSFGAAVSHNATAVLIDCVFTNGGLSVVDQSFVFFNGGSAQGNLVIATNSSVRCDPCNRLEDFVDATSVRIP